MAGIRCTLRLLSGRLTGAFQSSSKANDGSTRCTDPLLHDDKRATFETAEIARHVADLHEHDGFADYPALRDGYVSDGCPWIVHWAYAKQTGAKVTFF
jgi:hypothetical protein